MHSHKRATYPELDVTSGAFYFQTANMENMSALEQALDILPINFDCG